MPACGGFRDGATRKLQRIKEVFFADAKAL